MSDFSVSLSNSAAGLGGIQNRASSNIIANDQDAASFEALMGAPVADFKSKFDSLTPAQQDQIRTKLTDFGQVTATAQSAVQLASDASVEMNQFLQNGDSVSFMNQWPAYQQKLSDANSAVIDAAGAGIALLDTLESIDPTLPQSLPDIGANLLLLLKQSGATQEQIDRVATAFGIPS